jgi:hypothetical protein
MFSKFKIVCAEVSKPQNKAIITHFLRDFNFGSENNFENKENTELISSSGHGVSM